MLTKVFKDQGNRSVVTPTSFLFAGKAGNRVRWDRHRYPTCNPQLSHVRSRFEPSAGKRKRYRSLWNGRKFGRCGFRLCLQAHCRLDW